MIYLTGLETTHESIFSFFQKSRRKWSTWFKINICCIRCIWSPPSPPLSVWGGLDDVGFLGKPNSLTSLESQDEPPAEGRGRCVGISTALDIRLVCYLDVRWTGISTHFHFVFPGFSTARSLKQQNAKMELCGSETQVYWCKSIWGGILGV